MKERSNTRVMDDQRGRRGKLLYHNVQVARKGRMDGLKEERENACNTAQGAQERWRGRGCGKNEDEGTREERKERERWKKEQGMEEEMVRRKEQGVGKD